MDSKDLRSEFELELAAEVLLLKGLVLPHVRRHHPLDLPTVSGTPRS